MHCLCQKSHKPRRSLFTCGQVGGGLADFLKLLDCSSAPQAFVFTFFFLNQKFLLRPLKLTIRPKARFYATYVHNRKRSGFFFHNDPSSVLFDQYHWKIFSIFPSPFTTIQASIHFKNNKATLFSYLLSAGKLLEMSAF